MAADPLDQENAEHEAFGRERAHRFVGRKDLLDQTENLPMTAASIAATKNSPTPSAASLIGNTNAHPQRKTRYGPRYIHCSLWKRPQYHS
jgi:hypothetical protein